MKEKEKNLWISSIHFWFLTVDPSLIIFLKLTVPKFSNAGIASILQVFVISENISLVLQPPTLNWYWTGVPDCVAWLAHARNLLLKYLKELKSREAPSEMVLIKLLKSDQRWLELSINNPLLLLLLRYNTTSIGRHNNCAPAASNWRGLVDRRKRVPTAMEPHSSLRNGRFQSVTKKGILFNS